METPANPDVLARLRTDRQQFERRWATTSCWILAASYVVLMLASPITLDGRELLLYAAAIASTGGAWVWLRRGGDIHIVLFGLAVQCAGVLGVIHVQIEPGDTAIFYALPVAYMGLFLLEQRLAVVLVVSLAAVVLSASFLRVHPDPWVWSHRLDALIILFGGSILAWLYRRRAEGEAEQLQTTVVELSHARDAEHESSTRAELALAEAERANASQRRFLASMSHEMRTPLNAILGYTELVQESEGLDDADREDLARVLRAGGHLLALIDDVLDLARIEAGGRSAQPEPLDLVALAREAIAWTRSNSPDRGDAPPQSVELHAPSPVSITSDRTMVRQILLNLLGNAARHAPEAAVDVSITRGPGGEAVLSVQDGGDGIPEPEREAVFEAFHRGRTARERTPGAGLGLALVARFCDRLGGTIELGVADTGGARFDVTLPASPPEALVS